MATVDTETDVDTKDIKELSSLIQSLRDQVSNVIIGQEDVVDQVLMLLLSGGHGLLVGVPGLAKTLLVRTIAECTHLSFRRIQFTPDLMPSDITGTEVIQQNQDTGEREFRFQKGPIFSQVILADEINRTPPKTQAALLEAMEEEHVTVGNETYELPKPFLVLATQNPLEQEGTYPLPEAQLDRFMFKIQVDYPEYDQELDIIMRESGQQDHEVEPVVDADRLIEARKLVRTVVASEHVSRYALRLSRATRPDSDHSTNTVQENVEWGAGPRAGLHLLLAGRAHAVIHGEPHVSIEDVKAVAPPVLRHRILLNFMAEADGLSTDDVIQNLLMEVPEPGS
ncbi:MAG: AAA family ATPase [bacterium]